MLFWVRETLKSRTLLSWSTTKTWVAPVSTIAVTNTELNLQEMYIKEKEENVIALITRGLTVAIGPLSSSYERIVEILCFFGQSRIWWGPWQIKHVIGLNLETLFFLLSVDVFPFFGILPLCLPFPFALDGALGCGGECTSLGVRKSTKALAAAIAALSDWTSCLRSSTCA